jgi:hypothetical protein
MTRRDRDFSDMEVLKPCVSAVELHRDRQLGWLIGTDDCARSVYATGLTPEDMNKPQVSITRR